MTVIVLQVFFCGCAVFLVTLTVWSVDFVVCVCVSQRERERERERENAEQTVQKQFPFFFPHKFRRNPADRAGLDTIQGLPGRLDSYDIYMRLWQKVVIQCTTSIKLKIRRGGQVDRWRRTFVVSHLNRDFSCGYMDWQGVCVLLSVLAVLTGLPVDFVRVDTYERSVNEHFCVLSFSQNAWPKALLSFYACCTCCVEHADFLYSPQALELLVISSYLFIPLHPLSYSVVWQTTCLCM